jgi:hypothetical protein
MEIVDVRRDLKQTLVDQLLAEFPELGVIDAEE